MASAEQTRCMLSLFNDQFDTSKKEQIDRFLQDQHELNKRFDDYALNSDAESDESSATAHNLQKKYASGVTPEELHNNLHASRDRDVERDSLDSVLTACDYSESDDEHTKQPANHRRATPRCDVTPRRDVNRLGRSQSLRVANKVDLSTLKHAPQPPNSPDLSRDGDEKPPLESLTFGRRASLREHRDHKRKQPKKLLTKRTERPKSALGYRTSLSLVNEDAYAEEHGFAPPDRPQWHAGKPRAPVDSENSRSAPVYKNRVLNWNTDCAKAPDVPQQQDHIPHLLGTALDSSRSRGPSYAPAPLPPNSRPHPPPPANPTHFTRDNTVRQSMPIQKRHSESSMPLGAPQGAPRGMPAKDAPLGAPQGALRSMPAKDAPLGAPQGALPVAPIKDAPLKPISRLREFTIPIPEVDDPAMSEAQTGRMRRFKGHGNLAGTELTPRGKHLAVFKLPPVSHRNKKKTYPDAPVRHSDLPVRHSDLPARHSDLPARHSDLPARHSDAPVRHSDMPVRNSDLPARHSDVPVRRSDVPVRHSDVPVRRSDVPVRPGTSFSFFGTSETLV